MTSVKWSKNIKELLCSEEAALLRGDKGTRWARVKLSYIVIFELYYKMRG
jgi:hypothetical protein